MNVGGAAAFGSIILGAALAVCGGLWLGLNALDLPPAFALLGLANLYPRKGTPLALVAVLTRPAAVLGVLVAIFY